MPRPLRLAVLGAFPFPSHQGSQVFALEQARALERAGAEVDLVSYGRGSGPVPSDLRWTGTPPALSPRGLRSGPSAAKPLADVALWRTLRARHRQRAFDAVLAHNVEAAWVAAAARPWTRAPVVYVAHTLMGEELASYAAPRFERALARVGRRIDRITARAADAVLALTRHAADALSASALGPVVVVPPGSTPAPDPDTSACARACRDHGLVPGGFALYTGNLDGYQDLALLADAAATLDFPVVVATHDIRPLEAPGLRPVRVAGFDALRPLLFAAGALVLPRRRRGGFPIKLLNYMEARRPIVAFADVAEGLEDERSAVLLPRGAGAAELASAIARLLGDPERAARIGAGGREWLERRHAWPRLALETLALVDEALSRAAPARHAGAVRDPRSAS